MKMKKILAGVSAAALAVSAMAINASAVDIADYFEGSNEGATLYLVADDGKPQWAVDAGVDITTIYGVRFYATFDAAEVADESAWIGGGIGANSNSTGWKSIEWGRNSKDITADLENGTITWLNSEPIFQADDAYAHLWIQDWASKKTVYTKAEVLDKDGNVITGEAETAAAPAGDYAYNTHIFFADGSWTMDETAITVTGDGTYTIDTALNGFSGITVFTIEIDELGTDLGVVHTEDNPYDMSKCTIKDVKVTVDGAEVAVDNSKILWGDVEENGRVRVEIYNEYGKTKDDPGIDKSISGTTLSVTFTIEGINAGLSAEAQSEAPAETEAPVEATEAPAETEAPAAEATEATEATEAPAETEAPAAVGNDNAAAAADKNNADTGVEGVAVVAAVAVLACGAVVIAKKRK